MMGINQNQMINNDNSMDMHMNQQSINMNSTFFIEKKRRDILALYEDLNKVSQ
jgi:hypothetical protein